MLTEKAGAGTRLAGAFTSLLSVLTAIVAPPSGFRQDLGDFESFLADHILTLLGLGVVTGVVALGAALVGHRPSIIWSASATLLLLNIGAGVSQWVGHEGGGVGATLFLSVVVAVLIFGDHEHRTPEDAAASTIPNLHGASHRH